MATYSIGDIVAVRFPYSDLKTSKIRPGLVIGLAEFENYIICQITSSPYASKIAIHVSKIQAPGMLHESYIRPDKIFTADKSLILRKVSELEAGKLSEVRKLLNSIFLV
jgi:mRNA interferase MazF